MVDEIKHWSNPNYTRIVITTGKKTKYTHRLLKKDPSINVGWRRLYVDIAKARLGPNLPKKIPINDGLLKGARAGQYDKDTVRVVLDIESIEDYKIFALEEPYRIVIDVTGEKGLLIKKTPEPQPVPAPGAEPSLSQQLGLKVKVIVLDPGHGGKDPGAIGRDGLKEKDVTLRLGKMLREKLKTAFDGSVIMTRDTDVFIPLEERTAIANSKDADVFVSIHINASPKRTATGIETYILNISHDQEARRLAARENSTSTRSVSDLEFILNDLIKTAKTNDSSQLASSVNNNLAANLSGKYSGIKSNGVKGAPFYVLVGTKMPSILVEASFISNPTEEKRLQDEKYLQTIVDGIYNGIIEYLKGSKRV
ncbi:MAG: N-acetylmuramoyl-L-alanine amidase [Deltaproteobacteria bacterium]|nr:N-acetylmuramoyl-L-alanine amidase [Deltaproteobacteria bacterium]